MIDGPARRWIRWTRAVALGLAVMTATAAPVVAKPDRAAAARARSEAKRHFDRAESLYALGRFAEALTEYERAFELTPLPGIMENIAQAHRNLDHLDQAAFSYRKYLQLAPRAHDRAEVLAMIDELEAEARKRAEQARAASDAREAARAAAEARAAADARATAEAQARIDASLAARPAPRPRPIYRRWWFITGAAVVVAAATTAVIVTTSSGLPDSDLGTVTFPR